MPFASLPFSLQHQSLLSTQIDRYHKRFSFFDDICRQLSCNELTCVLRRMWCAIWYKQYISCLEYNGWLAFQFIFDQAFENIYDLFTRMFMISSCYARCDINPYLHNFATGNTKPV